MVTSVPLTTRVLAGLVVCALIGLTPLAYADPPDPLWIFGYWDDDDFDNVVVVILGTCIIPVEPPPSPEALWAFLAKVESSGGQAVQMPLRTVARPRAPPL